MPEPNGKVEDRERREEKEERTEKKKCSEAGAKLACESQPGVGDRVCSNFDQATSDSRSACYARQLTLVATIHFTILVCSCIIACLPFICWPRRMAVQI